MADGQDHPPAGSISISGAAAYGITVGTRRKVKFYGLFESDLRDLLMLNWGTTIFFTLGGIALGVSINWFLEWSLKKTAGSKEVALAFTTIAVVLYLIGGGLAIYNGSLLRKIKKESIADEQV